MRPIDIPTGETLEFATASLPSQRLRILEIGCGNGELAMELKSRGQEVVAVDSDENAVAEARRLGVDARVANFPDFTAEPFDCVFFTRSLHHIHPLQPALRQAGNLLKPAGFLLVEDFAFSEVHRHTADWFYSLLALLDACEALLPAEESFGRKLLARGGAFNLWHEHTHEINTASSILTAITDGFEVLEAKPAPYLYRYVAQMVKDDERGASIVTNVLELEKKTGAGNEQFLLGRRFVARKSNNDC